MTDGVAVARLITLCPWWAKVVLAMSGVTMRNSCVSDAGEG